MINLCSISWLVGCLPTHNQASAVHPGISAAKKNLNAARYAHVCVYEFAIPDFKRYGMVGNAYELIDEGWGKFTPCKGSASFSIFLEHMSGNPKFGIL